MSFCFDLQVIVFLLEMLALTMINAVKKQVFHFGFFCVIKSLHSPDFSDPPLLHVNFSFQDKNIQITRCIISAKELQNLLLYYFLVNVPLKEVLNKMLDLIICRIDAQFIQLILSLRQLSEKSLTLIGLTNSTFDHLMSYLVILPFLHMIFHNIQISQNLLVLLVLVAVLNIVVTFIHIHVIVFLVVLNVILGRVVDITRFLPNDIVDYRCLLSTSKRLSSC